MVKKLWRQEWTPETKDSVGFMYRLPRNHQNKNTVGTSAQWLPFCSISFYILEF